MFITLVLCAALAVLAGADPGTNFSVVRAVGLSRDFQPLYSGKIVTNDQLNLTNEALKTIVKPDYHSDDEGPEEDEDYVDDSSVKVNGQVFGSIARMTPSTTSTTTTESPGRKATAPSMFAQSDLVKKDQNFNPRFQGKILRPDDIHLSVKAKKVYPEPDYYSSREGPDNSEENKSLEEMREQAQRERVSPITSGAFTPADSSSKISIMKMIPVSGEFKPLYSGKVIPKDKLNLTEGAVRTMMDPDYYSPGEGPEDDDDYEEEKEMAKPVPAKTTPSKIVPTTTTTQPTPVSKPIFHIHDHIQMDPDFKPHYKGVIIPKRKLNLTKGAQKIDIELDYYDPGEGPEDEDDDYDQVAVPVTPRSTTKKPSTPRTTPAAAAATHHPGGSKDFSLSQESLESFENDDIEAAVGGISGIVQKFLQGPKKSEINNNSSPEAIYLHLNNIIQTESAKSLKAIVPRIYDYQYSIGQILSQRCFNSFVQTFDRLRQGLIWPTKMLSSSASLAITRFSLRDYGDFDRCLSTVAVDSESKPEEVFFTGQYCMAQLELPLPALNKNLTYDDTVLHFNNTELSGTFTEFVSQNAQFLYSNPVSIALCMPSTCTSAEIQQVIQFFLNKYFIKIKIGSDCYTKVNMTFEEVPDIVPMKVDTFNAMTKENNRILPAWKRLSSVQICALIFILASVLLVAIATLYEQMKIAQSAPLNRWYSCERNRPKSFVACFSLRYNYEQMISVKNRYSYALPDSPPPQPFPASLDKQLAFSHQPRTNVVDGLKLFALAWICLGNFYFLGYQPQMLPSIVNLRETITGLKHSAAAQLITQSWLSMEILFMISGFLLAYTSLPMIVKREGRPNIVKMIVKRYIRFAPSVLFLLLAISLLSLWQNAGPIYNSSIEKLLRPCGKFYWANLFFTANFYSHDNVCLNYFWYIGVEFQLTMVGILVTIFAYNRRRHAFATFLALILVGIIASGYIASVKRLKMLAPYFDYAILEEIPNRIQSFHFTAPVHFSVYFLGVAIGFYCRLRRHSQPAITSKAIKYPLWILLPLFTLLSLYIPYLWPFDETYKYDRAFTLAYYAVYRLVFVTFFAWILYQSTYCAKLLNKLTSNSVFRICSQISFQIYLLNMVLVWLYYFTKRSPIETRFIDSFSIALSLFLLTVITSLATYLVFEAPYRSLFRYYFDSPLLATPVGMELSPVNGKPGARIHDGSIQLEMNPTFLFSPHYNLANNISRTESETSSIVTEQLPSREEESILEPREVQIKDINNNNNGSSITGQA